MLKILHLIFILVLINIVPFAAFANEATKDTSYKTVTWPKSSQIKPETQSIKVQKVINPLTFISDKGDIYRLAGLDTPALSDLEAPAEFITESLEALRSLIEGKDLLIYADKEKGRIPLNHMGHKRAHFKTKDGDIWVQGTLLENGLARVRTTPQDVIFSTDMYVHEQNARENTLGLWALPQYAVLNASDMTDDIQGFQLIEGRIHSASLVKNAVYLNFEENWKKDFSIGIKPTVRKQLSKENDSPLNWAKKKVRIRGTVRFYNGPFIDLTHREQIEFINE